MRIPGDYPARNNAKERGPGSVLLQSRLWPPREQLRVGDESYEIYRLDALQSRGTSRGCRTRCGSCSRTSSATAPRRRSRRSRAGSPHAEPSREISFAPARVLLQDFTGVPCVVDLAAMRDAMREHGGDPARINPLIPAELVIDHSVQVDEFASRLAIERNVELEFERNRERYAFLRWGQSAFDNFEVVPPNTGIVPPGQPRVPRARRRGRATASRSRTRSSAPTRTRRWSTASACSAGASAGSRPRRRCSARRSRCSCRRSSASGSPARCPRARPRPTSCSR